MNTTRAAALAALLVPALALGAGEGEPLNLWPWASQNSPEPPPVQAYSLPTFEGHNGHTDYEAPIPALTKAPKIPAEALFYRVLDCYPAPNKWKLDVHLEARVRSNELAGGIDAADGTALGASYVGIVAKMPLYSSTEMGRERDRDSRRRQDAAKTVADFVQAIAARNHALRELGLYSSLEARSRVRVLQGIAETGEQVTMLEKVARSQEALIKAETQILEHRLKLVGYCEDRKADPLNRYLAQLAQVPKAEAIEPRGEVQTR